MSVISNIKKITAATINKSLNDKKKLINKNKHNPEIFNLSLHFEENDSENPNDEDYYLQDASPMPLEIASADIVAKRLCDEGDDLAFNGKFDHALELWSKALAKVPGITYKALLLDRCAQIFLEMGSYFKSVVFGEMAVILDKNRSPFYCITFARALLNFGELEKSIHVFKTGYKISKKMIENKERNCISKEEIEIHHDLQLELNLAKKIKKNIMGPSQNIEKSTNIKAKLFNNRIVGKLPFYETALPVDHSKDPSYEKYKDRI